MERGKESWGVGKMNKRLHKCLVETIKTIDSPYLCDQLIVLLEARREQLYPDSSAHKPALNSKGAFDEDIHMQ